MVIDEDSIWISIVLPDNFNFSLTFFCGGGGIIFSTVFTSVFKTAEPF